MSESVESLPLPDHPVLAAWASALNATGYWATLMDADWGYVFETDEMLLSYRDMGVATPPPIGAHYLSAEARRFISDMVRGTWASWEGRRGWFLDVARYVLASTPGGREELRRIVDPELAPFVDELQPEDLPPVVVNRSEFTT